MNRLAPSLTALVLLALATVHPADSAVPHFALQASQPAADAAVPSVDEIRLTFSQVPQEGSVSVRLVDPAGDALETGELQSDADDGRIVFVAVPGPVPNGAYTVAWRGIGDDGHVVRGDFGFTVSTQR